jgi:hypothetical protein
MKERTETNRINLIVKMSTEFEALMNKEAQYFGVRLTSAQLSPELERAIVTSIKTECLVGVVDTVILTLDGIRFASTNPEHDAYLETYRQNKLADRAN